MLKALERGLRQNEQSAAGTRTRTGGGAKGCSSVRTKSGGARRTQHTRRWLCALSVRSVGQAVTAHVRRVACVEVSV